MIPNLSRNEWLTCANALRGRESSLLSIIATLRAQGHPPRIIQSLDGEVVETAALAGTLEQYLSATAEEDGAEAPTEH